ncbi:MAG: PEP-CTERM sorting domain-containing protein [Pirellulales bacterium]|nr:PEP-CTERM sorting domain-containing protein [Pirellulales bacterium]
MDRNGIIRRQRLFFAVWLVAALVGMFIHTPSAADAMTLEELREAREIAKHRQRNLIFNNDGGDVIYGDEHTPQGLLDVRTSGLAGTQVDSLYYCSRSSGFGLFTHNTQVGEIFTSTGGRYSNNMTQDLIDQGTDVLEVMSNFARANDMEMIWSMRMNDTHDASGDQYLYAFPQLKVDHPEWLMGTLTNRPAYGAWSAVDYGVAEIRSLALAYVEEVCQNYDIDGVELDFFRHPFFFRSHTSGGTATQTDRDQMTQLMRDIRTMTEQVGMQRGSPILLSVRIPDSVGYCSDIGLDVTQWLQEDLIDTMAVSGYFRAEEWSESVALGHQYDVPVYACLSESRMSGSAGTIRNSFDSYMARASAAWEEGIDGIYMFNYTDDDSPLWNMVGDTATLEGVNKVYTTGARGVGYMSSGLAGGLGYLDRTVVSPEKTMAIGPSQSKIIPLTIGDDLSTYSDSQARARLRLQVDNLPSIDKLKVWLNNTILTGGTLSNGYLDYMLDLSLVNQGANDFRIDGAASLSGNVTLKDLLVYVSFRPIGFRSPKLEEPFLTGSPADPGKGEYSVGPLLNPGQAPDVGRFSGPWVQGQGTHPACFEVVANGLSHGDMSTRGGAIQFQSATAIAGTESVLRTFDASDVTSDDRVFYLAGLMSFDENFSTNASAKALTGLLNAEEGTPGISWTIGLQWGFQGDGAGGVDAVIRYRDDGSPNPVVTDVLGDNLAAGTHLFVVRVDVDMSSSTDSVMVWLDPSDTWSEAAPSLSFNAACWLLPSTDPNRLVDTLVLSVTDAGAGAAILFDEIRMGKTWGDLFLPLPGELPGDANGDGKVDQFDARILATNWLKTSGVGWTEGDFNNDGRVDDLDASILAANWGSSSTPTDVPEPSTWALLLGAALALIVRKRR